MTSCIAWDREKRVDVLRGVGKNAWKPQGFIAPNPRKVRGGPRIAWGWGSMMGLTLLIALWFFF